MARYNYFNGGDHYSEWHRLHEGVAYIDIDSVPICHRKGCWKPLAVIETVFDTGSYNKFTNVVQSIAKGLNIPAFLVYYKPIEGTKSLEFKVQRLLPVKEELKAISEQDWLEILRSLQLEHDYEVKHRWHA